MRRNHWIVCLGVLVLCMLPASAQATPPKRATPDKPAPKRSAPKRTTPPKRTLRAQKPKLLGAVVFPSIEHSIRRIASLQKLLMNRELEQLVQLSAALFFKQFSPGVKRLDLKQLLATLPQTIRLFGLEPNKPLGATAWSFGGQPYFVATLHIHGKRLYKQLQQNGIARELLLQPKERILEEAPQLILLKRNGRSWMLGARVGDRLHLLLRRYPSQRDTPKSPSYRSLLQDERDQRQFLLGLLRHTQTPLSLASRALAMAHTKRRKHPRLHDDLVLVLTRTRALLKRLGLTRSLRTLLKAKRAAIGISLHRGLRYRSRIEWNPRTRPLLQVFRQPKLPSLLPYVPQKLGWYGQSYLQPKAIARLPERLQKLGLLSSTMVNRATMGWFLAKLQSRAMGFDIAYLLDQLTGRFASGLVWDDDIARTIRIWKYNNAWMTHRKGVFVLLECRSAKGALSWLNAFRKVWPFLSQRIPQVTQNLKLTWDPQHKIPSLRIHFRNEAPFTLTAYSRVLLLTAEPDTRRAFVKVWQNKAPSLKKALRHAKHLKRKLQRTRGNIAFVHPRILRPLVQHFATPRMQNNLRPLLKTFQLFSTQVRVQGRTHIERFSFVFAPKSPKTTSKPTTQATSQPRTTTTAPAKTTPGCITGRVLDHAGKGIPGVILTSPATSPQVTDPKGSFTLCNRLKLVDVATGETAKTAIKPGSYTLKLQKEGYPTRLIPFVYTGNPLTLPKILMSKAGKAAQKPLSTAVGTRGILLASFAAFPTALPLTLVAGVSIPTIQRYLQRTKVATARAQVCQLQMLLEQYRMKTGRYPPTRMGLYPLLDSGALREFPRDPWRRLYVYRFPGKRDPEKPDIFSLGADGKEGGSSLDTRDIYCR